jgi:hypothetical protein
MIRKFTLNWFGCLGALASCLGAQFDSFQVEEVVPQVICLEAGGKQITSILRGSDLKLLVKAQVWADGKPIKAVFTQLGPPSDSRRTLSFLASPQCPLGSGYQVMATGQDGGYVRLPVLLTIVPIGDDRATLPDTANLAEVTQIQSGQRIVVSEAVAPLVTATIPNPLLIPPTGETKKILIQGRNLQGITEIRVRKFESPARYKGDQGLVPFRQLGEDIEVQLVASATTVMGTRYRMDLMVKKYLAASLVVMVGFPSATPIAPTPQTSQPNEVVIPLIPKAE